MRRNHRTTASTPACSGPCGRGLYSVLTALPQTCTPVNSRLWWKQLAAQDYRHKLSLKVATCSSSLLAAMLGSTTPSCQYWQCAAADGCMHKKCRSSRGLCSTPKMTGAVAKFTSMKSSCARSGTNTRLSALSCSSVVSSSSVSTISMIILHGIKHGLGIWNVKI